MKSVKKVVALGITASLLGIAPASNAAVSGLSDIKPAGGVATKIVKKKVVKKAASKVKYFKKYQADSDGEDAPEQVE